MKRLIISSDVFLWESAERCLIYNSSKGQGFIIELDESLARIVSKLQAPEALYSVLFDEIYFRSPNVDLFLKKVIDGECGHIVEDNADLVLSMKPILKIQDNASYFKWQYKQGVTGDAIDNLHNVVINIGSTFGDDMIAKQSMYPIRSDINRTDWLALSRFLQSAKSSYLSEISIVGDAERVEEDFLNSINDVLTIRFYTNLEHLQSNGKVLERICRYGKLTLLVRASNDAASMSKFIIQHERQIDDIAVLFETQQEYDTYERILVQMDSNLSVSFIPVFNGVNYDFMHAMLDIKMHDLLSFGPSKREVFINQTLNIFDFGKIHILPSGNVYSNMCSKPIGTIDNLLSEIIINEFSHGMSWLRTRDKNNCKNCLFRYLCPSPSNYEILMNTKFCVPL